MARNKTTNGHYKNLAGKTAGGKKGAKRSPWRGASLGTRGSDATAWRYKDG